MGWWTAFLVALGFVEKLVCVVCGLVQYLRPDIARKLGWICRWVAASDKSSRAEWTCPGCGPQKVP